MVGAFPVYPGKNRSSIPPVPARFVAGWQNCRAWFQLPLTTDFRRWGVKPQPSPLMLTCYASFLIFDRMRPERTQRPFSIGYQVKSLIPYGNRHVRFCNPWPGCVRSYGMRSAGLSLGWTWFMLQLLKHRCGAGRKGPIAAWFEGGRFEARVSISCKIV